MGIVWCGHCWERLRRRRVIARSRESFSIARLACVNFCHHKRHWITGNRNVPCQADAASSVGSPPPLSILYLLRRDGVRRWESLRGAVSSKAKQQSNIETKSNKNQSVMFWVFSESHASVCPFTPHTHTHKHSSAAAVFTPEYPIYSYERGKKSLFFFVCFRRLCLWSFCLCWLIFLLKCNKRPFYYTQTRYFLCVCYVFIEPREIAAPLYKGSAFLPCILIRFLRSHQSEKCLFVFFLLSSSSSLPHFLHAFNWFLIRIGKYKINKQTKQKSFSSVVVVL